MKTKLLPLLLLILVLTGCGSNDQPTLIISGIPDQDAAVLDKRFNELADYLGTETGLSVKYVPFTDYAALVTAFGRGEVHLGWFGGLTGVQARSLVDGSEAIVQRVRDEKFESVFIVNKAYAVKELEDLKGLSFTFGSESSTSGHLMPRYFLMEAGINPDTDFDGKPNYSGSHDTTWALVEAGSFAAGALNIAVWESALAEGKVDTNALNAFYTTPAYYDYNWSVGSLEGFDEDLKATIQEALLKLHEAKPDLMAEFQDERFIESKNENYEAIEMVAKQLGIIE